LDDQIEILPVSLLDQQRNTVNALKKLASSLQLEFGWHYLLDLTWIISHLGAVRGKRIMDAGAGTGILQWYLAEQGAEVFSVDRGSRASLPLRFRQRYNVTGLRSADLLPYEQAARQKNANANLSGKIKTGIKDLAARADPRRATGSVVIYNQDLMNLENIADNALDAVVAVSALEHNDPEGLERVVRELLRVLKPGGLLLASLCAGRDQDWFHEPSKGWCYSDASLRRLFKLQDSAPSNYDHFDELFAALKDCAELRDNLASFYSRSGDNGMPWGKWDPQYQPVGVCKVKKN
jgi:SAM-dependent methyltransferase